jgi:integrase
VIAKVPRMGLFKCARPEIEASTFDEYARILDAAKLAGEDWYTAVCLAGEAGLRVGAIKALRWREDVDMIARTITVRQQTCNGVTTTPKGRTRRTIPMTAHGWSTATARCSDCGQRETRNVLVTVVVSTSSTLNGVAGIGRRPRCSS